MKKLLTIFALFSAVFSFAQTESVKPTYGVDIERQIAVAEIEKNYHLNVTIELKAAAFSGSFVDGVKVIVTNNITGKKIYKKRFSKSFLYAFSDGTIQVGKGNAITQIILFKDNGNWKMILKEKGIY